jgi:hypothetical protein
MKVRDQTLEANLAKLKISTLNLSRAGMRTGCMNERDTVYKMRGCEETEQTKAKHN